MQDKNSKKEKASQLKNESINPAATKKGYNEKNKAQPQGAFPPDNKHSPKKMK